MTPISGQSNAPSAVSEPKDGGDRLGTIIVLPTATPAATRRRRTPARCSKCGKFISATRVGGLCSRCAPPVRLESHGHVVSPGLRAYAPSQDPMREAAFERLRREFVVPRPAELRRTIWADDEFARPWAPADAYAGRTPPPPLADAVVARVAQLGAALRSLPAPRLPRPRPPHLTLTPVSRLTAISVPLGGHAVHLVVILGVAIIVALAVGMLVTPVPT